MVVKTHYRVAYYNPYIQLGSISYPKKKQPARILVLKWLGFVEGGQSVWWTLIRASPNITELSLWTLIRCDSYSMNV